MLDIGLSDHLPIFISRKINPRITTKQNSHTTISYRKKKDFVSSDFGNVLVEIPPGIYEMFEDPNDLLDFWHSHFIKVLNEHAPLIKRRVRRNKLPGWFNSEIRSSSRKRDYFLKQFQVNKNSSTWYTYKKWRNRTVHIIKKSKEDYYKNLLTDNIHNPQQLWKILKDILPTDDTAFPIKLNINGKEISNPIEVGDLFNEYFSSIADNFDFSLQNKPTSTQSQITTTHIKFSIPLMTIEDILNLVAMLDQNKATGLDGIPAYFIRSSIQSTAPIILRICNMSIEYGVLPNMWKKARLIPIYKAEIHISREVITDLFQFYLNSSKDMLLIHMLDFLVIIIFCRIVSMVFELIIPVNLL